jgi:hypothetical protein
MVFVMLAVKELEARSWKLEYNPICSLYSAFRILLFPKINNLHHLVRIIVKPRMLNIIEAQNIGTEKPATAP